MVFESHLCFVHLFIKPCLSVFLYIFLIGDFNLEFQPEPSLLGDNDNSGEERDQFTDGTDVLRSEFITYIKASGGSANFFFLIFFCVMP